MACNTDLQKAAIRNLKIQPQTTAKGVLEQVRSVAGLENFTLEIALKEFSETSLERLVQALEAVNYKFPEEAAPKVSAPVSPKRRVSNIDTIFTSPIVTDLFDTLHIAERRFEHEVKRMVYEMILKNKEGAQRYTTPKEINNNLKSLKNSLFETIVRYLKSQGVDLDFTAFFDSTSDVFLNSAKLYASDTGLAQNFKSYKRILKALETELLGKNKENALISFSGQMIPNLKGDIRVASDRRRFDAYNAAIILSNFDNIIAKYFGKALAIDYSAFNLLTDPVGQANGKYSLKTQGTTTEYFSNGTQAEEGVETNLDQLTEGVISMMRHYNKNNVETGLYLDTKDFYSLASFIREFERLNFHWLLKQKSDKVAGYEDWTPLERDPKRMLDWYLTKILEANTGKFTSLEHNKYHIFRHRVDIVNSINNFVSSVKVKEANSSTSLVSILTQLLTNSYGANYTVYNAHTHKLESVEMHSHNADRVSIHNSVYAHLLSNTESQEKYWIGADVNSAQNNTTFEIELEKIAALVDTDVKLRDFIRKTLGIFVGTHGAAQLREKWGTKLPKKIQDYLRAIRTAAIPYTEPGKKPTEINVFKAILVNESYLEAHEYGEAKSPSDVINPVTTNISIMDIMDIYLDNFILRPIMNISTLTGEKVPTYKLANLMYSDTEVMLARYETEQAREDETTYRNLFINPAIGGLLGTATGLEVINNDINKAPSKFSVAESFAANFEFAFLDAFRPGSKADGIHVMIGNYADKGTIMSKIISKKVTLPGVPNPEFIIGNTEGTNVLPMDDVLELVRKQSSAFYIDLSNSMFEQYAKLGVTIKSNSFKANVKAINAFLRTFPSMDHFSDFVVNAQIADPTINITEELHYSAYRSGGETVLALNQTILDYYNIFTDPANFKKFVKIQEDSLSQKMQTEKGEFLFSPAEIAKLNESFTLGKVDKEKTTNGIQQLLKTFGIDPQNYKSYITAEGAHRIRLTTGDLNPLLKRWMWVNNLFRNEYLFLTVKPEFVHPYKSRAVKLLNARVNAKQLEDATHLDFDAFLKESSARIPNMSKRNVSFTATYENPVRESDQGVPSDVNVAVIKDASSSVYNPSGQTHNQDIHDGASFMSDTYSRMIEASYPGKGYEGTKKRIATFITEYGSALKKDAETVITNERIRGSIKSDIKLKTKQRQMLGTIPIPNIGSFVRDNLPSSSIYYKNGFYYQINKYSITNNVLHLNTSKYNVETGKFDSATSIEQIPIKTLYDVWEAFGGEYSSKQVGKGEFDFSEGSNDLLFDLVTKYNVNGTRPLKSAMIHIVSNKSTFKSGATNVHPASYWNDDTKTKLAYATYKAAFIGPQLDAGHEADASKIKEITQIISALAQSPLTAHIAKEVYEDLARIIKLSAEPYIKKTTNLTEADKEKYYRTLSHSFAFALSKSDNNSLAKTIAESFGQGANLPFSSQSFFREFSRNLITRMNNEFIVRYYSGIAAVLNPSHRIVQIFESADGTVHLQGDLAKKAFAAYKYVEGMPILSNEQIIENYISTQFQPEVLTSLVQVQPEDVIQITDLDGLVVFEQPLNTIDKYYQLKEQDIPDGYIIKRLRNVPRDLRPAQMTFSANGVGKNIFDLESVKLRYVINTIQDNKKKPANKQVYVNPDYIQVLKSFVNHFKIQDTNDFFNSKDVEGHQVFLKQIDQKLNAWTQRNLALIDKSYVMKETSEFLKDGSIDFAEYFGGDPLLNKRFDEVYDHYIAKNAIPITDYKFKAAELILPNIYKSTFDVGNDSMATIRNTVDESGKNIYFQKKLDATYQDDNTEADLKIILGEGERPVYVKYVHSFPPNLFDEKSLFYASEDTTNGGISYKRLNTKGEPIYTKPDPSVESLVTQQDGYDVVYFKIGKDVNIAAIGEPEVKRTQLNKRFEKDLKSFIKSFNGQIKGIIPLMNNPELPTVVRLDEKTNTHIDVNMNKISYDTFKAFSGFVNKDSAVLDNTWFFNHKAMILEQLGIKTYVSWEKSHEIVSARIPAQSMQSFMEMKNIGYFNTDSNDAYVSIWQIWLQGSDFDIDKSYIMGYSFNKNGQYDTWSPGFDYSTKEQLDALEMLPLPTGSTFEWSTTLPLTDVTNEFVRFAKFAQTNPEFLDKLPAEIIENNLLSLSPDAILALASVLQKAKVSKNYNINIGPVDPALQQYKDLFLAVLKSHNSSTHYLHRSNSIKNSVVAKIRRVISAPSNQLLATAPVSIDTLHDAGDAAKERWGFKDEVFSMWDMLTMYKQQSDASIGKIDVGIGANGLKVFFALSNYYNSYYTDLVTGNTVDFHNMDYITDPKSFEKKFVFDTKVAPGVYEAKARNIYSIANTDIPAEYITGILNSYGYDENQRILAALSEEQAALAASGFVSGATDNAKELVMAKINAVESLASMHLYLVSLGVSFDDISIYMNSPLARHIAKEIAGNVFASSEKIYIGTIIDKYVKTLTGERTLLLEERKTDDLMAPAIDNRIAEINAILDGVPQFRDIYDGGQEFKVLASVLKVNQKTSANVDELNKFLSNIETAIFAREQAVLGDAVVALREPHLWDIKRQVKTNGVFKSISLVDAIIEQNSLLKKNVETSKPYVHKILQEASEVPVSYIDEQGFTQSRTVSMLGGQFDFRYYMHPANQAYRDIAIKYYNLFKNTINIFDVIENSPHFKSMVEGVSVMHTVLSTYSAKYNFAFNKMRDLVRTNAQMLVKANDKIKHKLGNEAFSLPIKEATLAKIFRTFDTYAIAKWLKSDGEISKFSFNAVDLMKLAKEVNAEVSKVTLFKDNDGKTWTTGEVKSFKTTGKLADHLITVTADSTEDFVVDLTTDYGIANFKILMEEVIFKILQQSKTATLADSLKLTSMKNSFGLPTVQIVSTFNISDMNSPVNMEKFQELLANFNEVDSKIENNLRVPNANGKRLGYKDLFYVYNLVVNNEMYGNKRLTPLFDDYIKHKHTVAHEYLEFSSGIDSGQVDIFELPATEGAAEAQDSNIKLKQEQTESILFSVFGRRGELTVNRGKRIQLKNSNFPINTFMAQTDKTDLVKYMVLDSILTTLKNKNLIINFNCN